MEYADLGWNRDKKVKVNKPFGYSDKIKTWEGVDPWNDWERRETQQWNMAHEGRMFDEKMDEEKRRYDLGFARDEERYQPEVEENRRRYDQQFGENVRQTDRGFAEGVRREDRGFDEGVRREDRDFGENLRRFNLSQDALGASQARGEEAMGQYDQLFNTPLAELGQYEQSIIDQSTPGQENARQATIAALAKQGVRGPQAALETSRQAGMMGQGMQSQLAGLKFKEAMDRRASKGKMKGEMTLQGLGGGL